MTLALLLAGALLVLAAMATAAGAETLAANALRSDGVALPASGQLVAAARRAEVLIADVSGFVTDGELQVVAVEPVEPDHDRNLRWFAGALHHSGDGPLARAIARLSSNGRVTEVRRVPGIGIEGLVDRHPVRVGDHGWLGVAAPTLTAGGRAVAVEVDGRLLGSITVAERVRPEAPALLRGLERAGWTVVLQTTLGEVEAARIGAEVDTPVRAVDGPDDRRTRGGVVLAPEAATADDEVALRLTAGDAGAPGHQGAVSARGSAPVIVLPDLAVGRVAGLLSALRALPRRVRALRVGALAGLLAGAGLVVVGLVGGG